MKLFNFGIIKKEAVIETVKKIEDKRAADSKRTEYDTTTIQLGYGPIGGFTLPSVEEYAADYATRLAVFCGFPRWFSRLVNNIELNIAELGASNEKIKCSYLELFDALPVGKDLNACVPIIYHEIYNMAVDVTTVIQVPRYSINWLEKQELLTVGGDALPLVCCMAFNLVSDSDINKRQTHNTKRRLYFELMNKLAEVVKAL